LKHRHIPTLDGWRGVAIAGVLYAHSFLVPGIHPHTLFDSIARFGSYGVEFFFVLSGFLISTLLLDERTDSGGMSLKRFYVRRVFRLLPAALVYLMVISLLGRLRVIDVTRGEIVSSIFLARNYVMLRFGPAWFTGHFWSLSLEEHFYLLWPGVLCAFGLRQLRVITPLAIGAGYLWMHWELQHQVVERLIAGAGLYFRTDMRVCSLLFGCLLALIFQSQRAKDVLRRMLPWPLVVGLFGLFALLIFEVVGFRLAQLFLFAAPAFFIAFTVLNPSGTFGLILESAPLRWLGRISYSLYIWQQLWFVGTSQADHPLGWLQSPPLNFLLALSCASASYYLIERPLIRLGHRLTQTSAISRTLFTRRVVVEEKPAEVVVQETT
jgi:peptidoglycan/LPS O-acetylase OafA/YrhL